MKRLLITFLSWIASLVKNKTAVYTISILVGIAVGIWVFLLLDKTPATEADYKPLEEQAYAISQNPDLLYETEGEARITKGKIELTLRNSECILVTKYNSDFEVIETTRQDASISVFWAIFLSTLLVIAGAVATLNILILLKLSLRKIRVSEKIVSVS